MRCMREKGLTVEPSVSVSRSLPSECEKSLSDIGMAACYSDARCSLKRLGDAALIFSGNRSSDLYYEIL
jgi:hypothetical protein